MVLPSSKGCYTDYTDLPPPRDWYRGKAKPSWQEMTSLTRQEGMVLPTPKASGRTTPWRVGPECPCPSTVLHLGQEGARLLDVG